MPHDKNGQLLQVGSKIIIEAEVESITEGEEFCNVTVRTTEPMYPGDAKSAISLNAKQVILATPT